MKKIITFVVLAFLPFFIFSQTIASVSPATANAGQTLNVTITGTNTHFQSGSGTSVSFGYNQASMTVNSINISSETSITANLTVPSNTYTGDYNVFVYNSIDGNRTLTGGFHVNGITPPSVASISPATANAGQTLNVTITGANTHFQSGSSSALVSFGYNQASMTVNYINISSETSITANVTVPPNIYTGDYNVTVYNSIDGNRTLTNGFHVNGIQLVSINPGTASAGQTLNVTITGANTHFTSGSATISFNFNQASGTTVVNSLNIVNDTSVQANITVPSNTYTGDYNVNVYNSIDGTRSLNNAFHVNGVTPPSISSISPATANAGQTLNVTITGANTHFQSGSGTSVSFGFNQGSSTVNSINVSSETSITANITVPSNTYTGDYNVNVYNSIDNTRSLNNAFHVNGITPPSISSISPATANAGQTLNVTITGANTHFQSGSGTSVSFSFNQSSGTVNSINVLSETSITANVTFPVGAQTGDYNVNVYNSIDGTHSLTNGFHVNGAGPPSLVSVNPSTANAGQTLNVIITGANTHFSSASGTNVNFYLSPGVNLVNSINIINDTSIQANITIPSNIYTVDDKDFITVSDAVDGSLEGLLSLTKPFHVNGITPPSLVSISPSTAAAGQTLNVTITGVSTHFNSGSPNYISFSFNQISGTVVHSVNVISETSIQANITIPSNTQTGYYNVEVSNAIEGLSLNNSFHIIPNLLVLSIQSTNVSSFGLCDGTASVAVSNGTSPYSYK